MDQEKRYISFSATFLGEEVRITIPLETLEIVTRDNENSYAPESIRYLTHIEFEDIYS